LGHCIGVFPQRKHRQLLNVKTKADPEVTSLIVQHRQRLALLVSVRHNIKDGLVVGEVFECRLRQRHSIMQRRNIYLNDPPEPVIVDIIVTRGGRAAQNDVWI
ncbi:MAG TPA: hypothetical protein VF020_06430, partial [Chthoniobacterales bacterium]